MAKRGKAGCLCEWVFSNGRACDRKARWLATPKEEGRRTVRVCDQHLAPVVRKAGVSVEVVAREYAAAVTARKRPLIRSSYKRAQLKGLKPLPKPPKVPKV